MTYLIFINRITGNHLELEEVLPIFQYKEDNNKLFYVFSSGGQEIFASLFQQETLEEVSDPKKGERWGWILRNMLH